MSALVAVVDDDDAVRDLVVAVLGGRGYATAAHATVTDAAAWFESNSPDLAILDVDLPDGCGLDLIEKVRTQSGQRAPVIVLSGRRDEGDFVRGFAAGAADYLSKPFAPAELLARCAVHLARASSSVELPGGDADDLPSRDGRAFGRYTIERLLGRGGYGEVYLARDEQRDGARVALKVLAPLAGEQAQLRARFVRETYTLSTLRDPRVARVHDVGSERGRLYFTMDYVDGASLYEDVVTGGPQGDDDVLALGRGLLETLRVLERHDIVHRDIKPANIILRGGRAGDPVLVDFGLAKRPFDRGLTTASTLLGTAGYIAPEVIRGRDPDARADLFGVGLCLRFALTGENVFPGLEGVELLAAVMRGPIPLPSRPVGRVLGGLLAGLLATDPDRRTPSAQAALDLLDALTAQGPG